MRIDEDAAAPPCRRPGRWSLGAIVRRAPAHPGSTDGVTIDPANAGVPPAAPRVRWAAWTWPIGCCRCSAMTSTGATSLTA